MVMGCQTMKMKTCPECNGTGRDAEYNTMTCYACEGTGTIPAMVMACLQCRDRGRYRTANFSGIDSFGGGRFTEDYCNTIKDEYCDCPAGIRLKAVDRQIADPSFVNPFAVMTDEEIISMLSRTE